MLTMKRTKSTPEVIPPTTLTATLSRIERYFGGYLKYDGYEEQHYLNGKKVSSEDLFNEYFDQVAYTTEKDFYSALEVYNRKLFSECAPRSITELLLE